MKTEKGHRASLRFVGAWLWVGIAVWTGAADTWGQGTQTVNWTGGNLFKRWDDAANWSPAVVPWNAGANRYTVIVPANSSISYLSGGAKQIDALSFGDSSTLDIVDGHSLEITGVAVVRGLVQADGPGSGFRASGGSVVVESHPRFRATEGAVIALGSSIYDWAGSAADADLIDAQGAGSLVDLGRVSTFNVAAGSGARTFTVRAAEAGVIDLSGAGVINGPGGDDWLNLNLNTGGDIRLDALRQVGGRVRFNVRVPAYDLPFLLRATTTEFVVGTNVVVTLPSLLSLQSGGFLLQDGAELRMPGLSSVESGTIALGAGSQLKSDSLRTVVNSSVSVADGATADLPGLATLDTVPLTLTGSGALVATNLAAYRLSDIPIWPGRDLRIGTLTDFFGSRISVTGGAGFRVGATDYDTPASWQWYGTLFSADGAGSVLDLSSLRTMQTRYCYWGGYDYRYMITAKNSGVIDLSGLENLTGPEYSSRLLEFNVQSGGRIHLPMLREVSQYVRFNLGDGMVQEVPSLTTMQNGGSIGWGFNSEFRAPNLRNFPNSELSLAPGRILTAPPFTNVFAARFFVSGGQVFRIGAVDYDTPESWQWYGTLFSADGAGSVLDLSSLRTMRTRYCNWGGYSYRYLINANNNGVIDLSGLESLTGPEYSDRLLEFNLQNGGRVNLSALREVRQYVRFNLGDGTVLEAPSLTQVTNGVSFGWGFNSEFRAPNLRNFLDSELSLAPGRILTAPLFTNVFGARFAVSGGQTFRIAASDYDTPASWQWYGTLLSADGAGSRLDLSSFRTMRTRYCNWGGYGYRYLIVANNKGVIDLSGLESLTGPQYSDRLLEITVSNGGSVVLGDVGVSQYVSARAFDQDSRITALGLRLGGTATLSVTAKARLQNRGHFSFENTDPNTIVVENASVQMDGSQPQRLEVGGKDLGPNGSTAKNFGYSQLIVGETNRASVVRLVEAVNNGNRGAGGDSECLYLYGLDGAGLRLLHGSRLVLNGLKVYALVNGQMQSLVDLIPPGTNSAPLGDGFIARSGGPKITRLGPALAMLPPVGAIEVDFDLPIVEASFTPTDVTLSGPGGEIPVTAVTKGEGDTYRIAFAPQSVDGSYTLRVGPAIDELAGNLSGMDQDGDGLGGEVGDDVFVGTFTIDGQPPGIVGAFSVQNGTRVGIRFDEPVDEAGATNPATYAVNGAVPQKVELREDRRFVALTVPALLGDSFALAVTDIADALGNRGSVGFSGTILALEHRDLGTPGTDPREAGSATTWDGLGFENVAGGTAIWDTIDRGQWLFERRVGDFDVRVRLASLVKKGSWTQAGLMARESADARSRHVFAYGEYGTGYNRYTAGYRATTAGASAYWAGLPTSVPVPVPNAWFRLKREGDLFLALRSTNGIDWIEYSRLTQSLPATLLVGLATSANNNGAGQATTAVYGNYGDLSPGFVAPPQNQSLASGVTAVFGATARGEAPLSYQWFHDGEAMEGATASTLEIPNVQVADVGDYRVQVSNAWGTNLSAVATLSVDGVGVNGGLEADVSPSPRGDGTVTIQDWVKTGLFVAALEETANSSQFQRADCAPAPCGDGRLSVADWTQAGLYAAALVEPVPSACGPTAPAASPALAGLARRPASVGASARALSLEAIPSGHGSSVDIRVMLEALGDENAVGFSVAFDPAMLRFESALADGDAFLQVNARQAAEGRVGLALARGSGEAFPAGRTELARLRFFRAGNSDRTDLDFADRPIGREVVDARAAVLETSYQSITVTGLAGPKLESVAVVKNGGLEFTFAAESGSEWIVEISSDLGQWSERARRVATGGTVRFTDEVPVTEGRRFYRLRRAD